MYIESMDYKMHDYIPRIQEGALREALGRHPVVAVVGPRQCGKSTLVRHCLADRDDFVMLTLDRPSDLRKLDEAEFFLSRHADRLVCIDEVQLRPDLFPLLRALVDDDRRPGRFLILGSAGRDLLRQSSETLAGRIHYLELTPFEYREVRADGEAEDRHWFRGGFPRALLAEDDATSREWQEDFIQAFLSRDLPQFGSRIPPRRMHRFWQMLAHVHGGLFNASKLGQSLDLSHVTMRSYLDLLEQTFMVRVLRPLEANLKKRLIKSPKVFIRDSGILHALLEIPSFTQLAGHPVFGASWEGWCIEQIAAAMRGWRLAFYRTSGGAEIDLLLEYGHRRLAFEFKASAAPILSRGLRESTAVLEPERTWVVAPVRDAWEMAPGITAAPISKVLADLQALQPNGPRGGEADDG